MSLLFYFCYYSTRDPVFHLNVSTNVIVGVTVMSGLVLFFIIQLKPSQLPSVELKTTDNPSLTRFSDVVNIANIVLSSVFGYTFYTFVI